MFARRLLAIGILYSLLNIISNLNELLDAEVEHNCIKRCPLQNRTDEGQYELDCGYECSISKCVEGCKLWKRALESSCQTVCNGTLEPLSSKELYCVMSCNDALTRYFNQLKAKLGTPIAPALVADSLTSTSLRLEWKFPEAKHAGLKYFVQWRYEELAASWQYCRNHTWGPDDTVIVDNLQPYTKYRFRVALLLSPHSEPIVSAPSVVISTLPAGVPTSPPIIVRAVPIDCTRISVSWEPGPFPHGPLLSYVLHITDSNGYSALKDISAENTFYIYRDLIPARNYTVSISMINGVGTGPSAHVLVSTPPEALAKEFQQPVLVLNSNHLVIEQGTDMLAVPMVLYKTEDFIKGIAIHVSQQLLFVSDSAAKVHKISFKTSSKKSITILSPPHIDFLPLELSVDWLNNQLYILGEVKHQRQVWQITRCDLDGHGHQVALAGLRIKPHHIEVDPYNGFLFWVIQSHTGGGLFRLDLADISNGIKHNVHPEQILAEPNLGAFTVDHTNFRLLCSNQDNNTIYSVSLDGKEIVNVRPKIITRKLQKVLSLATANKTFYWTNGNDVFYEEFHSSRESYYHNTYPDLADRPYLKVLVNLQSSQPTPVPINPPTLLQAIFGLKLVKITWKAPHLLGDQGKGAWQNWSYEISIKNVNSNYTTIHKNINVTSCTIQNLDEDKEYIIKAAAYTNLGKGPWSSEFRGKTLKVSKNGKYPTILWSASNGLLKSDATGENVQTIIQKNLMKDYYITDIAWYNDQIYLVTNNSQIFWHNLNTHKGGQIIDIDSVSSIAVDWLGKKLYWSNPKQQLILRGNLNGTQQEPLPILTLAKELNIDAVQAYLYWSTGHAVECARLNGADRMVYHPAQLFSGKQVMGLTLDMHRKMVYWIIRGSEGSNLFRAPMAGAFPIGTKPIPESISSLQKPDMQGPLCYFNDRLLWLKDDKNAVISDLMGKNIANIQGKELSGLTMIFVMDYSLYTWPNNTDKAVESISVIPEPINRNSIKVIGFWNSFNITWQPCQNVNFGTVFYEIKVDSLLKNTSTKITTLPSIKFWQPVSPFTKLHITIKSYTFWGSSPIVRAKIYSPPSTPSAPENLRTYLSYNNYQNETETVDVTFRWDAPLYSNGLIQGYKLRCWYKENFTNVDICERVEKKTNEREHILKNLERDQTYYVQVQAYTEIGDGEFSQVLTVNTDNGFPLPKLLVASTDSIFIQDIDKNKNYPLLHGISTPIEMAYIIKENKVFWINDMKELLVFNLENLNRTKICDLSGDSIGLTVDWVERSLYYIQNLGSSDGSSIYKLDLNHVEKGAYKKLEVFRRPFQIYKIDVSPFTRKLYWVEVDQNNQNRLMQGSTDGNYIQKFFSNNVHRKRDIEVDDSLCNCPLNPTVETVFAIDHSDSKSKPSIVFVDSDTLSVLSANKDGCKCEIVAHNNIIGDSFPLHTLKSDFGTLYYTNATQGLVYSLKKNDSDITNREQINAKNILIYGSHMQPYPPRKCLLPILTRNISISLLQKTSSSLKIGLPDIETDEDCQSVSTPTIEYKIYYKYYNENESETYNENCTHISTFNKIFTISGLQPFTKYLIIVAIRNYFSENNLFTVSPVVIQTSVGAPSKPENVTATILTPTLLEVSWAPPKQMNAESVSYEIHWQTAEDNNGIRQKGEQVVPAVSLNNSKSNFNAYLYKLSPNETYNVWIRAYSQSTDKSTNNNGKELISSDSNSIKIRTYPEPDNITLLNSSADELTIQSKVYAYAEQYILQFTYLMSNIWINISNDSIDLANDTMTIRLTNLKPKTQYKFRMIVVYPNYSEPYIWPGDFRFRFETLGDRPSPPGMPIIQHIKADVYQVWWESSKDNGAVIEMYLMEGLMIPNYRSKRSATSRPPWYHNAPSIDEHEDNWIPLYNGTDTFWIITGLHDDYRYAFRVSALNAYGWSNTSEESSEFDLNVAAQLAEKQDPLSLFIIAGIPVFVCIVIVIFVFCCCRWCCSRDKEKQVIVMPRGPDVELATLRELPRRWIHNTNILYTANQLSSDEITMLPHIRRDQITLMKFLGSGAFGEVFEGKARNITNNEDEINVAIKTLRKGASDTEKCEFLQEAQLMSHFKHEHILQLLGVCLDNDPQFIIMELMQGGDLLTYLRSSRNPMTNTPSLTLKELIKMCVDVAKGCRYLEEMHFVHRDLACRNCLVSAVDPDSRIVKIGDFGLTRDIYKNDYYRKEGEGLLPVRWMAPESLVDGVFTCQSDVWAFGVLLWEIMTLGQQPYPARTNLEVLHFVKSGGRLGKPVDCPEKLHELMLKCWNDEPERRPTFKYCLITLEDLHVIMVNDNSIDAHNGQYITTVPQLSDGVFNQAYFQDEFHTKTATSWKHMSDDETDKERTPFLNLENDGKIPTYLELIYDKNSTDDNDGYEIPRSSIRSNKSEVLKKNTDESKQNQTINSNANEVKSNDGERKLNGVENKHNYINHGTDS